MKRILAILMLACATARAEMPEADATYFHPAASLYIHGDTAAASNLVAQGLAVFPDDGKLKRLKELIEQQQEQKQQDQDRQQNQDEQQQEQDNQQQEQQPPQDQGEQPPQDQGGQDRQPEPEPQSAEEMSADEAQQLLDAMKQDEKNKRLQLHPVLGAPVRVDKDW